MANRDPRIHTDPFSRLDDSDDRVFYATDRFVSHLDSTALATIGAEVNAAFKKAMPKSAGFRSRRCFGSPERGPFAGWRSARSVRFSRRSGTR